MMTELPIRHSRKALLSELKVMQAVSTDYHKEVVVVAEEHRFDRRTPGVANIPFVLYFQELDVVDRQLLRPSIATNAWPSILGPELFFVVDTTNRPVMLEYIPMFGDPPSHLLADWKQRVINALRAIPDPKVADVADRVGRIFRSRMHGYTRVLWPNGYLTFLISSGAPEYNTTPRRVWSSEEGEIDVHVDDGNMYMVDGWIKMQRPRRQSWKIAST